MKSYCHCVISETRYTISTPPDIFSAVRYIHFCTSNCHFEGISGDALSMTRELLFCEQLGYGNPFDRGGECGNVRNGGCDRKLLRFLNFFIIFEKNVPVKITDDDYKLRTIFALEHIEKFTSGATVPMLLRGICKETHEKGDYVVKYLHGRMDNEASCRELLGSFLAMQLGLNVPEPVLIEIQQDFIDTIDLPEIEYIKNCLGYNFGCEFVKGYVEILNDQTLNEYQVDDAINIFGFDILISNTDRRVDKHNLMSNGQSTIIFDHELAFGFLLFIFPNPEPWNIIGADLEWIKKHVFYKTMIERKPNFEVFVNKLDFINDVFWTKAELLIPKEWKTDKFQRVKNHIESIKENKDVFLHQLNNLVI